jgi:hypothetical protein
MNRRLLSSLYEAVYMHWMVRSCLALDPNYSSTSTYGQEHSS